MAERGRRDPSVIPGAEWNGRTDEEEIPELEQNLEDGPFPPDVYERVVVCRKRRTIKGNKSFYPVYATHQVRPGPGLTWWVSDFAGNQHQADALAFKIGRQLAAGEEPSFPDDGGAGIKRVDERHAERLRAARQERRERSERARRTGPRGVKPADT